METVTYDFSQRMVSTFRVPAIVDKTIDEINAGDDDALAIPSGFEAFGFDEEAYDERLLDLIRLFDAAGKTIAAVCVAAPVVGKSGVPRGRRATTRHLNDGRRQGQLRGGGGQQPGGPGRKHHHVLLPGNGAARGLCPLGAADLQGKGGYRPGREGLSHRKRLVTAAGRLKVKLPEHAILALPTPPAMSVTPLQRSNPLLILQA